MKNEKLFLLTMMVCTLTILFYIDAQYNELRKVFIVFLLLYFIGAAFYLVRKEK